MTYILAFGAGSFIGGLFFTSLFAWLLGRVSDEPAPVRYFFAWFLCALWGLFQFYYSGAATIATALTAYALAAIVACALSMRKPRPKDESATFE